jgi:hypothetical protein
MGAKTLLTVEHLERLPETVEVSFELDQGEPVELSSASLLHTYLRDRLVRRLLTHLDTRKESVYVVSSATSHPAILAAGDLLEDAALLPGFSARVEELFAV